MTLANFSNQRDLLTRSAEAIQSLRKKGFSREADMMAELYKLAESAASVRPAPYFTQVEIMQFFDLTVDKLEAWVAKGMLSGEQIAGEYVFPKRANPRLESLIVLESQLPKASPEEIDAAIAASRKEQAWRKIA